jgi:hypothetical protein
MTQTSRLGHGLLVLAIAVACAGAPTAAASAGRWSGTYRGHGTGAWPKNTILLAVARSGRSIPTYRFRIDTLCGKANAPAARTDFWPFTSQGSPPLRLHPNGSFSSTQRGHFTISRIPGVMSRPAPASYVFKVSGVLRRNRTFSGHLTLRITTANGYVCSDTNSRFDGRRTA